MRPSLLPGDGARGAGGALGSTRGCGQSRLLQTDIFKERRGSLSSSSSSRHYSGAADACTPAHTPHPGPQPPPRCACCAVQEEVLDSERLSAQALDYNCWLDVLDSDHKPVSAASVFACFSLCRLAAAAPPRHRLRHPMYCRATWALPKRNLL